MKMANSALLCIQPIRSFVFFLLVACIASALNADQPPAIAGTHSSNPNPQTENGDVMNAVDADQEQLQNEAPGFQQTEDDYHFSKGEDNSLKNHDMLENVKDSVFYDCAEKYDAEYCQYLADKAPEIAEDNSNYNGDVINGEGYAPLIRNSPEKRRLRFVKRRLRFVKKNADDVESEDESLKEKRRLRFVKKSTDEKRRLRFIKKSDSIDNEKRRLRFVKKDDNSNDNSLEKRRLRFVKKDANDGGIYSHVGYTETGEAGDTSPEKRRLRFIKRRSQFNEESQDSLLGNDHGDVIAPRVFSEEKSSPYSPLSTMDDENSSQIYNPHKIQRRSTHLADPILAGYLDNNISLERLKRPTSVGIQRALLGAKVYDEAQRLLREKFIAAGKRSLTELRPTSTPSDDVIAYEILAALLKSNIMS